MAIATLVPPPRSTANPAPARRPGSVRRTSSMDVTWPSGDFAGDRQFVGRVRDFLTPADGGEGRVLDFAELRATLDKSKTIKAIAADPAPPRLAGLVGQRAGNHLRLMLRETMPELLAQGRPLYLVLDDLSGTGLISGWGWVPWDLEKSRSLFQSHDPEERQKARDRMVDVCWGFQLGNSSLDAGEAPGHEALADAGELRNPADPEGWHVFAEITGPAFRRARRIEVTREDGLLRIDSAFQDSALTPQGGRAALHEYNLRATADAETLELLAIEPEARVLPFSECPGAVRNTQRLVGSNLAAIRTSVLAELKGAAGCTHLNDALRALAEVPHLAQHLGGLQPVVT